MAASITNVTKGIFLNFAINSAQLNLSIYCPSHKQKHTINLFTMTSIIKKIKSDLYNVFVKGESDKVEQARVFVLFAVPFLFVLFTLGRFPGY